MPHLFTNRPRVHNPSRDRNDLHNHFRWETVNAMLYLAGGIVFIIGSVFFFPSLDKYADLGACIFLFGSFLYLVVTGHDMVEVRHNRRSGNNHTLGDKLETASAFSYLAGTILFTVGSTFFLSSVGMLLAGTWCFIIGSLLFVVGACINVLQIVTARSLRTLQLMNLTAVSFVVGSVLFMVASAPYLWNVQTRSDRITLFSYIASEYVVGSVLFLLGGLFNYRRAWLIWHEELRGRSGRNEISGD